MSGVMFVSWGPGDDGPDPDPHPRYDDYPTTRAYEEAFHLWRARQRDNRLTDAELAAKFQVIEEALLARHARRP